jgi:hypothetical protein
MLVVTRTQLRLDVLGDIRINRTRMSLLLVDSKIDKDIKNHVRLHFQFASQLVYSDFVLRFQSRA